MARFEPFEPNPELAVAVSGGADSLALLLLLDAWTKAGGGSLLALTVDHGLRPEAAAEAAWVAERCAERGIAHRTLAWRPPHRLPAGGPQAAARAARYRLLARACREAGILHLVLGHQREDQGETFLLRLAAGSGPDGLAAMPAVAFLDDVRILRPLLECPRRALEALLHATGQEWLNDPSNANPAFARPRLRAARAALTDRGLSPAACAGLAETFGRLRSWSDAAVGALLVDCCRLDPRGFAWLERAALLAAPPPLALRALARLLRCLAGRAHSPRGPKLLRLLEALRAPGEAFRGATLAGCRILPRSAGRLLVVREAAAIRRASSPADGDRAAGTPEDEPLWDGRFRLCHGSPDAAADTAGPVVPGRVPAAARAGLPTSCDLDGRATLPHFSATWSEMVEQEKAVRFAPRRALTAASFTVFR